MAKKANYQLIAETKDFIIVNKAAGLLSIPDRFRPDEVPNLYHMLKADFGEIYIVHRLDKDTSGIICFARTAEAHKNLSLQFEERKTKKTYWALVLGQPYPEEGRIDAPIAKHPTIAGRMAVARKGKPSITDYSTLETFKQHSLLACDILTGRTHQIRLHLKHLGHSLVVDPSYGGQDQFFLSEIKGRKYRSAKYAEERPLLKRVPLHAYQLQIADPSSGESLSFQAAPPKDMRATLSQLRKWAKA